MISLDLLCTLDNPKLPGILQGYDDKSQVKVRQEEENPPEFQRIYVKDFHFLSLHDHHDPSNSPKRKEDYHTPPLVRVPSPNSHISNSDAKISSKASKIEKKVADGNKPKKVNRKVAEAIKPSSVLLRPPRAVLSSPENDLMLGTKNKTKTQRSGLKDDHKLSENTHAKCKKAYELDKRSRSWIP